MQQFSTSTHEIKHFIPQKIYRLLCSYSEFDGYGNSQCSISGRLWLVSQLVQTLGKVSAQMQNLVVNV